MGRNYEQACPVAKALELLGERWTLLIVRDLILGRSKFNELQESLPGITASVLSERLKNLEKEGVVDSRLYSEHPPRLSYHLTKKGRDLGKIVGALYDWGQKYTGVGNRLVGRKCGHSLEVDYFCPVCKSRALPQNPLAAAGDCQD
ncbi:MAG: helix-turn-helix domain-containing protein [Candidatus Obscuribacter sp.]|nr:helix-turn-helix domain-containing protein [Candidatus Obscuribacter sp.]